MLKDVKLQRREFLKAGTAVLALAGLAPPAFADTSRRVGRSPFQTRSANRPRLSRRRS